LAVIYKIGRFWYELKKEFKIYKSNPKQEVYIKPLTPIKTKLLLIAVGGGPLHSVRGTRGGLGIQKYP
jgi:hypothetical protein